MEGCDASRTDVGLFTGQAVSNVTSNTGLVEKSEVGETISADIVGRASRAVADCAGERAAGAIGQFIVGKTSSTEILSRAALAIL